MNNIKVTWDGEPTNDQFDKAEQFKNEFEATFPGLTVELIGSRPKDRG